LRPSHWGWKGLLTVWLMISLACNLPTGERTGPVLPAESLRQTLIAQSGMATLPFTTGLEGTQTPHAFGTALPLPPSGLATATPRTLLPGAPTLSAASHGGAFEYYALSGDTLEALVQHFEVNPAEITSDQPVPQTGLIPPGQWLNIPNKLGPIAYPSAVLPDSQVVYSPVGVGFDLLAYIAAAGGYLNTYTENFNGETISGAEALRRVAVESSINPRLLLALLEFRSGWVFGNPADRASRSYPIGFHVSGQTGLYRELVMAATHLNIGYYGWRQGTVTQLKFKDNSLARISPELNAGSVAIQYLLAKFYDQGSWVEALYGSQGLLSVYQEMFGDPWQEAAVSGVLLPAGLTQPALELPFASGERWSLTGGPHPAWKTGSPRGALDFAPVTGEAACAVSRAWVLASAAGLVVRSERNVVALDLDGDGHEQTGWVIIYMHVADKDRVAAGAWVNLDDRLGHPSCEGGTSTGSHVHIARKYNGEWLAVDGPLPFVLSGWVAFAGEKNYQGELRKGSQVVVASPVGPQTSIIVR
jgi:LasA protease